MSSTGPRFRTPADVRAIPNDQWERWLRDNGVPFGAFAATFETQKTMRTLIEATRRRIVAKSRAAS